jgi:hypothetical protein
MLARLLPHLLYQFSSEQDLIRAIQEMSEKFTTRRDQIGDYLKDPRLVSAYAAFYLSTNMPKFEAILPWLPAQWCDELRTCDLIDLGAGPGTFSLAFRQWAGVGHEGKIIQLETSELMRAQARRLWDADYPPGELVQLTRWSGGEERKRLVIFGHSANEMGAANVLRYLQEIQPQHILFIEPGTSAFFPEMLKIREALLQDGFEVLFPCPGKGACPMQGSTDWCHQFIRVTHGPEIERLTQLVHKDRRLLPLIVHAYSRSAHPTASERVVRVLPETKFSFEWEVCHDNRLEAYQLMKKDLDKGAQKKLAHLLSGAAVKTELIRELEDRRRVRLREN